MRKLWLIFSLFVLLCLPQAANAANFSGIGDIDLGPNVTVGETTDKKGALIYNLRTKDGAVWRGASLFAPATMPNTKGIETTLKLDAMLTKMIKEKFSNDEAFLAADSVKIIKLGQREAATCNIKMSQPSFGFMVINMNMSLIPSAEGLKMVVFISADSDAAYWQPAITTILAHIE